MRIEATLVRLLFGAVLVSGCRCAAPPPSPSPAIEMTDEEVASALAGARRVGAGDLDGDGRLELVAADERELRVLGADGAQLAALPAPGGVQVLRVADVDGDGRSEILVGWGRTVQQRNAPARASLYRLQDGALVEVVLRTPATERSEIVDLLPTPEGEILVAFFESRYDVRVERIRPGSEPVLVASIRMATSLVYGDVDGDGTPDLVIGRPYGDTQTAAGDAFVLRPDGERIPIPIVGGVRAMALTPAEDGRMDLLIADGWDRNYGRVARALLSRASWDGQAFTTRLLEESPEQFVFWSVHLADLSGDGRAAVVTRGPDQVRVVEEQREGVRGTQVAAACDDVLPVNLDGRAGDELIVLCAGRAQVLRAEELGPR